MNADQTKAKAALICKLILKEIPKKGDSAEGVMIKEL